MVPTFCRNAQFPHSFGRLGGITAFDAVTVFAIYCLFSTENVDVLNFGHK